MPKNMHISDTTNSGVVFNILTISTVGPLLTWPIISFVSHVPASLLLQLEITSDADLILRQVHIRRGFLYDKQYASENAGKVDIHFN